MDIKILVSMRLEEAQAFLKDQGVKYEVEYTCGGKDKEILTQMHVIRAIQKPSGVLLTATGFRTSI